jgi:hypothetical protein
MTPGDVRGDPRTIDGAWMTEALESAGVARGATVTDVEFVGFIGTGQTGRNARLALTWDVADGRPQSVVGKFPSDDPTARSSAFGNGTYLREFSFYEDIAATVDIAVPRCWVRRFDETTPDFVLIMEDLRDSEQGDHFAGCTPDEAALAIQQAVGLHGPRWGDPTLPTLRAFEGADEAGERLELFFGALVEGFVERLGDRLDDDVIRLAREFGSVIGMWPSARSGPRTVVHGDFRPDNFLFGRTPTAPPLVVVDWQTVGLGAGPSDIAYLVGGSFAREHRSDVERELLEEYRGRLVAAGIDYSADGCWHDFRLGSLHGVLIAVAATVISERTTRGDDLFTLMATRHAQHALDLDALSLLR